MTPAQVNSAVRDAYKAAPNGGLTGVSATGDASSSAGGPLARLKNVTAGFIRAASSYVNPFNILVPGGEAAAKIGAQAAKNATAAAKDAAAAAKQAVGSAADGISSGFRWITIVVVVIAALWAYSIVRPRG